MKKITSMTRVIDIFSTEPVETCQQLLDAAQQILKQRRVNNTPPKARKAKPQPETAAETVRAS